MLFVDSSAWYAAADRGDTCHSRATEQLSLTDQFVTSDYVLVETWLLLRHRLGFDVAQAFWAGLRAGAAILEAVSPADLEVAWTIAAHFSDQPFSLVDCSSFALMQRLGVHRAVSFDDDFAIFRYGPRRDRAFEILR
ncbi:MAG: PIN domain-containing protein [Salinisphaera sp.]|nr:PIN domain-containing protein [Salinisphaera sp.]